MKGRTYPTNTSDDETDSPTTPDTESDDSGEADDTPVNPGTESNSQPGDQQDADTTANPTGATDDEKPSTDGKDAPWSTVDTDQEKAAFEASVSGDILQTMFELPSRLLDESRLFITDDEITLSKPDPANVALARVTLDATAFDAFTAQHGELAVNINRSVDIVNFYDADDTVTLELTSDHKLNYNDGGLEFNQGLIDPASVQTVPDLPEMDDIAEFTVETAFLERGVTAADMVSDHMRLTSTGDSVTIEAEGDTDTVTVTTDDEELSSAPEKEFSVLLSLDYMKTVANSLTGDTVAVEAGTNKPIFISGEFADGAGRFEFMVAPRLEDTD